MKKKPGRKKGTHQTEEVKKRIAESMRKVRATNKNWKILRGKDNNMYKDGRSSVPGYKSWLKNKRNRLKLKAIRESGSHTLGEWDNLKAQYNWTCPCCGKQEPEIKLTQDHIIPFSKGGSDNIENIQPLCASCNSKKQSLVIKYNPKLL